MTIHEWHLQLLMIEIYRTNSGLKPCCMKAIFLQISTSYNVRVNNRLDLLRVKTGSYGIQSAAFLGISLGHAVPNEIKNSRSISIFKNFIKYRQGEGKCPCRLCKQYLAQVGFCLTLGISFFSLVALRKLLMYFYYSTKKWEHSFSILKAFVIRHSSEYETSDNDRKVN